MHVFIQGFEDKKKEERINFFWPSTSKKEDEVSLTLKGVVLKKKGKNIPLLKLKAFLEHSVEWVRNKGSLRVRTI